ncbi:MAG: hypothetical protein L6V81_11460 [Clostridium sp.]|nr:MAG: hypothetical protein L6V81_11460 [Clostridium sp.]
MVARVENKYQIEYYTLDDAEVAQKMYNRNKKRFETQKKNQKIKQKKLIQIIILNIN